MIIDNIHLVNTEEHYELSADVGGSRLWYKLPIEVRTRVTANPFVAAAFFPAAVMGEAVIVAPEYGVSPQLRAGLKYLQEVFGCWNPELKRFPIESQVIPDSATNAGTASFFSGGVDGLHTLLVHREEITAPRLHQRFRLSP